MLKSFPIALASLTLASTVLAKEPTKPKPTEKPAPPAAEKASSRTEAPGEGEKPRTSPGPRITTLKLEMRDGLRFDPPRLSAKPGDPIVIKVSNVDSTHQTHNFLLLKPGKLQDVLQLANALGEKGPTLNFIPASDDVLVHTAILNPDEESELKLKLPETPGIYPYVCTFPGHGLVMYGALYVGVPMPELKKDPNIPPTAVQAMIAGNGKRPFVQRMFLPDSGPATIAVALSGEENFAWDAGQCRLRYAWHGSFIDASEYWRGNGRDKAKVSEIPWWSAAADSFPLRFGKADAAAPKVKFLGYQIQEGIPEFHYRANEVEVFEKIIAGPQPKSLQIQYRLPKVEQSVVFLGTPKGSWSSSVGTFNKGFLSLTPQQALNFTITLSGSAQ